MKKVLVITYYWAPAGGAGVQRWLKTGKYLPQFGIEPLVLTVDYRKASYPQTDPSLLAEVPPTLRVECTDTFELYSLYTRFSPQKEIPYGGFANERKPNLFQKIARFVRGNFFLPDPRRGWNRYAFRRACQLIEAEQIETIITTSPPHSTQLIGAKLKRRFPALCWIADLRDPWTDIYYYNDLYPTRLATAINRRWERKILREADSVLTVSEDLKRIYAGKIKGFDAAKILVVPNGYDEEDFSENAVQKKNTENFVITYTGTMSDLYDISALIEAIKNFPAESQSRLRLRFVGKVMPDILRQLEQAGLMSQVELTDYVPHKQSIEYLLQSDLLLLVIAKTADNKGIVTGKLYEYLASRVPILCLAPTDGDAARIIADCEAGQTFDYVDRQGVSAYLNSLYEQWETSRSVQNHSLNYQKYSRRELARQIAEIISNQ